MITHLRLLWSRYSRRVAELEQARRELDQAIEDALGTGLRQSNLAHLLGADRRDIHEALRRQARRRERGEIE